MSKAPLRINEIIIFRCIRHEDETGVSGTGDILYGIRWPDGSIHVKWNTTDSSIGIFPGWAVFWKIHIASHPSNKTEIQVRGDWILKEDHEFGGKYEWHTVESL